MTPGELVETIEADGWVDIFAACPGELKTELGLELMELDGAMLLLAPGLDAPLFNRVIRLGVSGEPNISSLERMLARFHDAGVKNYRFQPCPWAETERFRAWTADHGLIQRDRYAKVLRTKLDLPLARTSLRIEEVSRAASTDFAETACAGFGLPELAAPWLAELVERTGWRCYVARDGAKAVAAAAFRKSGTSAWLGVAATLSTHRGRGAQSALLARRIADAIASDAPQVITETGDDTPERPNPSLRNILRSGFEIVHWRRSLGPR
jgi:hypothetical protein